MQRAQLIMNPEARRVTPAMQRVVESALRARFKLDAVVTKARDSAIEVARDAVESGAELIVAFGGDGLVNEVVNGIAEGDATLAIVPGGTMNVLARNLGIPKDPLEATDKILRSAGTVAPKEIRLGLAGDRLFTFVCGCGFDAEVAEWIETHKPSKRRFGEPYFYAAGVTTFLRRYAGRRPYLRCEGDFGTAEGVLAMGLRSSHYAYLAGRPVRLGHSDPDDDKVDLFLLRDMRPWRLPAYALGAFVTGRFGADSLRAQGLESFTVSSGSAFPVHVDGEPIEPVSRLEVGVSPKKLKVLV